jgi:hypothetical protein
MTLDVVCVLESLPIHLYISGLCYDTVSSSGSAQSQVMELLLINNELERLWKEAVHV